MNLNFNYDFNQQPTAPESFSTIDPAKRLLTERGYLANLLKLNIGKVATVYQSFPDTLEKKDEIFKGKIEAVGIENMLISDPTTGTVYSILIQFLNYVIFDEPIKYIEFPTNPLSFAQQR